MSQRAARRAAIDDEEDEAIAGDGMVARIAERAFDNPAMFGGLVVMALTACAIVSNAMLLQNGRHPEPLFMTRPSPVVEALVAEVPLPRVRADQTAAAQPMPPLPRVAPSQPEAAEPAGPIAPTAGEALIADLQRALAEKGLYRGEIDGISGSRTRAAITAYEKTEGLPVTGQPSATVLDHIRTASITPAPEAAPALEPEPVIAAEPLPAPTVAEEPPVTAAPETAALESYPPEAEPAPAPTPVAATPNPELVALQRDRYQSVQYALNQIGYGPVTVDGKPSDDTENAIRRFELDNGLPITGLPGDKVIERLMAIGALKPT